MSEDQGQTGSNDDRKDNPGDGPNDASNEGSNDPVTGVSDGNKPKLEITPPAPPVTTPKAADSGTAVATDKAAGSTGEAPAADEKGEPKGGKASDAVVDNTNELQKGQQAKADGTTPKKEGDEYRRDNSAPAEDDNTPSDSAVRDTKKARTLLNQHWGLQWPDPVMLKIMQTGSVTKSSTGITFDLEDGGSVKWHRSLQGQGEFVGKTGFFSKMNEKEAEATIAICKNRGWKKVTLYGSVEQKEMMWLEAKKQDMEVTNFAPMADSPILQKWAEHQAKLADKTLAGVSNGDKPPIEVKGEIKPGSEEAPKGTPPAEAGDKQKAAPTEGAQQPTPAAADEGQPNVVKSNIGGNLTARPTTEATAEAPANGGSGPRREGESLQEFFGRKIEEVTHPKLREHLSKMRDALSAPGVDEAVVKAACEKLSGRVTVGAYNEAADAVNQKNTGGEPLAKLGGRGAPGPKVPRPT
jgi:hypothetical protein